MTKPLTSDATSSDATFTRRVLIVALIAVGVAVLWLVLPLLLLVFGAVLVAATLRTLARPLRWVGLGNAAAVAVTALVATLAVALLVFLFGAELQQQWTNLYGRLDAIVGQVARYFEVEGGEILKSTNPAANIVPLVPRVLSWGWSLGQAVLGAAFVAVAGLYIAFDPAAYRAGLIALVPKTYQENAVATLDDVAEALNRWLGGMLISMLLVGALTGAGLWFAGVHSPLALGLLAGVANFVPYLGSIVAAIVTLLFAAGQGWEIALWAAAVMAVVQQIESNVITPLVVGRAVSILPATGLFSVLAMALLFGPLGVLFGFPLAIVADIVVRRLYIRDALDKPVDILGEPASRSERKLSA